MIYTRPLNRDELLADIGKYPQAMLLAGGTDLINNFNTNNSLVDALIDIKKVTTFSGIREEEDHIEIGSLSTIREIQKSELLEKECKALWQSACNFASVQIRNRATIGGNICNASPAGDTLPALYAMNAQVKVFSSKSERLVPVSEIISGPGKTSLEADDIIESILIPKPLPKSIFFKLGLRQSMAIAVFNFAIAYEIENDRFTYLKISAGAVGPTVMNLENYCEAVLASTDSIDSEIDLIDQDISPIDDIRASADYRRMAMKNVIRYTLKELVENNIE